MFNQNNKLFFWSSIISTIATIVLAATALVTVYVTVSAWKAQSEASRPYFILKESPTTDVKDNLTFEFRFYNVGTHPALNLASKTLVFEQGLDKSPIHHDEYAIVNDIPKDAASSLIITVSKEDLYPKQLNITPHYILVVLQYMDPILMKQFQQTIFWKWNGVHEGVVQPIVHVKADEKDKVLQYLKVQKINLLTGT